ncbi:MAG: DNA polymerase [Limnohabitans sp.]|nr:DNA polymerase [Limnohabitans sp.]
MKKTFKHRGFGINDEPTLNFELIETSETDNPRFHQHLINKKFIINHNFDDYLDIFKIEHEIDTFFKDFFDKNTTLAEPNDIVSLIIKHEELDKPIYINSKMRLWDPQDFLNKVFQVTQSNSMFLFDGKLHIQLVIVKKLTGSGKRKAPITIEEHRHKQKKLIKINNNDNSCGLQAIALSKYKQEYTNPTMHEYELVRKNLNNRLVNLARQLGEFCGIDYNTKITSTELAIIDSKLKPEYQIICVNGQSKTYDFIGLTSEKKIFIEHLNDHYNVIFSMKAYLGTGYFCESCFVGFNNIGYHICKDGCKKCHSKYSSNCNQNVIECTKCGRDFNGYFCLENHIKNKICSMYKRCKDCCFEFKEKDGHTCGVYNCKSCNENYTVTPHFCHITSLDIEKLKKDDSDNKIFVAFDIESTLETIANNQIHKAFILISFIACYICFDNIELTKHSTCNICGEFKKTFIGSDCVKQFGDYLYNNLAKKAEKAKSNIFVFAHNFKGYDGHFIIQDLFNRKFTNVSPILNGSKILKIDVGNVRFIDTLSFFQQSLESLPKAFGMEESIAKGYFPYKFFSPDNTSYIGDLPDKLHFDYEKLSPYKKQDFDSWYNSKSSTVYNIMEEAIKYCSMDVEILFKSFMKFRTLFILITEIDPITRNFTLAAIGLEIYRAKFLKEKTLGITPINSYKTRKQSKKANAYLDTIDENKTFIKEFRVGPYYVDAFDPQNKYVYEYNGCFFHGCAYCRYLTKKLPDTAENKSKYELTKIRNENIRKNPNINCVINIWECIADDNLKNMSPEYNEFYRNRLSFYTNIEKIGEVSIRESFFGGRTNNIRFYYEIADNEEIKYMDVCSEYPFVLKTKLYPVGHPEKITMNFDYTLQSYFGFIKCKVLPPKNLFLPVLPLRINKKLEFVLCFKCAKEKIQEDCNHSNDERALINTWTSAELQIAVIKVYQIVEIYQVLNYEKNQIHYLLITLTCG